MTKIRAIVTDIEGTTSSISFVHDVLFPYARKRLPAFVETHGDRPEVQHWLHQAALEAELIDASRQDIIEMLLRWSDEDRKSTALKVLQGMIWKDGYSAGEYRAHVYPEVAAQLRAWHADGRHLYVYSKAINEKPEHILFLSDIAAELDAASAAGWLTAWLVREPLPLPIAPRHPFFRDFNAIIP